MTHPAVIIHQDKLVHNVKTVLNMCRDANIQVSVVTKAFCAYPAIIDAIIDCGVDSLADSRIMNLKKLANYPVKKTLLRIPMLSEVEDVVQYADISLNSELETLKALSAAACKMNKKHSVIIMIDMGDLREGILEAEALDFAGKAIQLKGIQLLGIGTNMNCYGGIIPTACNLSQLAAIAESIRQRYDIPVPIVSGGNSGTMYLLEKNQMPQGINHLRIGETILRGVETSYQNRLDQLFSDVFQFRTEIVELKEKPSVPFGQAGINAYGVMPQFSDKGLIRRAIVACGHQDVLCNHLVPFESELEIIGASSDHMIIDLTRSKKKYQIGDTIDFHLDYGALVSVFTSEYVHKIFQ